MTTSVYTAFIEFTQALAGSGSYTASNITHRDEIMKRLTKEFGNIVLMEAIGSFENGTDVAGHSDADYLVWLGHEVVPARSDSMLRRVKESLSERFPNTLIQVRTPAVQVLFAGSSERIEVVPAGYLREIGGHRVYKIAGGAGDWAETAPGVHNAYVESHDIRLNRQLKPLIRAIKAWKYAHDLKIGSFYLELRTAKLMETTGTILYEWDLHSVIKHLATIELSDMQDPCGVAGLVPSASAYYRQQALTTTRNCAVWAGQAREAERAGDSRNAFYYWNLVFNGWFPKYG